MLCPLSAISCLKDARTDNLEIKKANLAVSVIAQHALLAKSALYANLATISKQPMGIELSVVRLLRLHQHQGLHLQEHQPH